MFATSLISSCHGNSFIYWYKNVIENLCIYYVLINNICFSVFPKPFICTHNNVISIQE